MRLFSARTVATFATALLCAAGAHATEPEPCTAQWLGASLSANILDIALGTTALSLLNGKEDPRLKRLLELRLVQSAAAGHRDIDQGARFPEVHPGALNLVDGIDRAIDYAAKHRLDRPSENEQGSSQTLPADLTAIKAWLQALSTDAK